MLIIKYTTTVNSIYTINSYIYTWYYSTIIAMYMVYIINNRLTRKLYSFTLMSVFRIIHTRHR